MAHLIADWAATAGYIVLCVFLFSLSIAIHEFGHFIVAKRLGYRVEKFSIGFGHAIWKKTVNGVEYRIGWIPFGGYVSIPDVDPEGTKALEGERGTAETEKIVMPPWKDLAVAVAGPAMNIVFAVIIAFGLYPRSGARFGTMPAVVGDIFVDSPADKAGLQAGDTVLAVGGHPVKTWSEMISEVQFAADRETQLLVKRGDGEIVLHARPKVEKNGVAYLGALSAPNDGAGYAMWMPERGVTAQLLWDAGAVFRALKGLVTPREMKATGRALGGPVLIARSTYATIRRDFCDGIGFLRFINTNLAVMNLLPIPVLDGGLILFSLIAIVFRRRLPEKIIGPITMVFMYLLIGLMLFMVGRDIWRIGTTPEKIDLGVLKSEAGKSGGVDAP